MRLHPEPLPRLAMRVLGDRGFEFRAAARQAERVQAVEHRQRRDAELACERDDVIEVRPKLNEILFKGRANLSVKASTYVSDTVACTLDFTRCTAIAGDQDLPPLPASVSAATTPR